MLTALVPLAQVLTPLQALVLGAVQGLTELLPVSSSAHLYAVPTLLGWTYEGVAFDVALHGGTLVALVIAFGKDWWALATEAFARDAAVARAARGTWAKLVVATIPGAIAGKLLERAADTTLRWLPLQAIMLAVFGLLLWLVDRGRPGRDEDSPGWGTALGMGFAQCLALVPGVSRSGVTMTAGRATGLSRVSAARFSFLLATPITAGALVLKLRDMPRDVPAPTMAIGVASAAVFGILAIRWLLALLRRTGFGVFFAYRAVLAAVLLAWVARHGA
jgi:undecaprenyl-diphosphatase